MRQGYKITLGILTIMILFTITVGTSYSFYSVTETQETPNNLTASCFNVSFAETSGSAISLSSDGKYAFPISDSDAVSKLKPYNFTITNNCTSSNSNKNINYTVVIGKVSGQENGLTNYLKYQINEKNGTAGSPKLLTTDTYQLAEDIKTSNNVTDSYKLVSGTLAPGSSKTYDLYLWIKDDACTGNTCETEIMGKNFQGKIILYTYM